MAPMIEECYANKWSDLYDAARLLSHMVVNLTFLPSTHTSAVETYIRTLAPPSTNPPQVLHTSILALQSTIQAMLTALSRPPQLISQITAARKAIERHYSSVSRSTRWPLGLLDETRQRINEEKEEKARRTQGELDELAKELRYTQQTVASELAGWQDMHERMGRRAIKEYARSMLILERERMQGIKRALRKLQDPTSEPVPAALVQDVVKSNPSNMEENLPECNEGESSAIGEVTANGVDQDRSE
jgi:predicted transcriptional regulator